MPEKMECTKDPENTPLKPLEIDPLEEGSYGRREGGVDELLHTK